MDTHQLPRLRLYAEDKEDMIVLSAHLQDSLIPMHSMRFVEEEGTFSGLCHRFCWEHEDKYFHEGATLHHRVHTGLAFRHVESVHHKGFSKGQGGHLSLLSLRALEEDDGLKIHLIFSGESEIKLNVKKFHCHMGDIHHPWPAVQRPRHFEE